MKFAFKNIIVKAMIVFMAILLINLDINSLEFTPIAQHTTLGDFNYFNSFTEYISEVMLNSKDAFPEFNKESTSSKSQLTKHFSIKLIQSNLFTDDNYTISEKNVAIIIPLKEDYSFLFSNEINPPPPKA